MMFMLFVEVKKRGISVFPRELLSSYVHVSWLWGVSMIMLMMQSYSGNSQRNTNSNATIRQQLPPLYHLTHLFRAVTS